MPRSGVLEQHAKKASPPGFLRIWRGVAELLHRAVAGPTQSTPLSRLHLEHSSGRRNRREREREQGPCAVEVEERPGAVASWRGGPLGRVRRGAALLPEPPPRDLLRLPPGQQTSRAGPGRDEGRARRSSRSTRRAPHPHLLLRARPPEELRRRTSSSAAVESVGSCLQGGARREG
jgi:hypothetical protein